MIQWPKDKEEIDKQCSTKYYTEYLKKKNAKYIILWSAMSARQER